MIFDRFRGVLPHVVGEGTHFLVPWVQRPIIFSVRSKPRRVPVVTGSKGLCVTSLISGHGILVVLCTFNPFTKGYTSYVITVVHSLILDLQNVDITLRILFRPEEKSLPWIFTNVGVDLMRRFYHLSPMKY